METECLIDSLNLDWWFSSDLVIAWLIKISLKENFWMFLIKEKDISRFYISKAIRFKFVEQYILKDNYSFINVDGLKDYISKIKSWVFLWKINDKLYIAFELNCPLNKELWKDCNLVCKYTNLLFFSHMINDNIIRLFECWE